MKKLLDRIKKLCIRFSHLWTLSYILIYMPWFTLLEKYITPDSAYHNIHVRLDDMIPFCEYFVIPYLLWFLYVPVVMGFLAYRSREEYYRAAAYLFTGMTICLFICTVWHNGQDLRIENLDTDKNVFTAIMGFIYHADTNTNVFPSIHSFNSVAVWLMLVKTELLHGTSKKTIVSLGGLLSASIVLSTLFLKQHSVVDAIGGVTLALVLYVVVYCINWKLVMENQKAKKEKRIYNR